MGLIVIDANVAVKWVVAELHSDKALAVLDSGLVLMAPELIRVEVPGAISRKVRNDEMPIAEAQSAYRKWLQLLDEAVLEFVPTREMIEPAFAISLRNRHNLIDCVYVAVAEAYEAPLLTADEPLFRRCHQGHPCITLLNPAA